jgi:large subunit ribosomal protein L24
MNKKQNCHIKKGDTIKIISGSNKGFVGKISSIIFKTSSVFIEGIPPRIKYSKNSQNTEGKKIELQIPIHISNVMLWDKIANFSSKIGYKTIENKKCRYFKKSGNIIENQKIKI